MVERSNSGLGYSEMGFKGPKRTCDRCGLTYYQESQMRRQRGLWLCTEVANCFDELEDKDD